MLDQLFAAFDHIIVLDVETTGLNHKTDEIIEFGGLCLHAEGSSYKIDEELNMLIRLTAGHKLSPFITNLTGITQKALDSQGIDKKTACDKLVHLLDVSRPLVVSYNAQFDLCFLYYFLSMFKQAALLKKIKMLDALTVYRDRQDYPHKLANAIDVYDLKTQNTHRAIDDARAALELIIAMDKEYADLDRYINLFGINAKYGISGPRISSITYKPQGFSHEKKLYEK